VASTSSCSRPSTPSSTGRRPSAAPFGFDAPPPLALHDLARRFGVGLVEGELTRVDVERRIARVDGVEDRPYDHLLVAVGARREPAVPGALTFRGERDVPSVRAALDEVARRNHGRVVVVVPVGIAWPLPAYELAILTRSELDMRGAEDASVTLVTPEQEPLWIFGEAAGDAIRELLDARGIALRTGARPARAGDGVLWLESGDAVAGDTVLSLPRLSGRRVGGLPADTHGFLPTDAYGRVVGAAGVLAAGDVTTFPVKQGGLATQQADAAAATIAHELGAAVAPQPFAPVLRGLLLTGGAPLYLRAELDPSGERRGTRSRRLRGETSSRALWWPPGKIAARYLAPHLSMARPVALVAELLEDRVARPASLDPAEQHAALDLVLMIADEDAEAGDLSQALHALDAAAALTGGALPAPYAERRERWRAGV
jgi:sulfide:quinone oxidoreductase